MRYFLHIAYNGKNYSGWQIQTNQKSVQYCLEYVLSTLFGEVIEITGTGRTDAGVHAKCFYAHFNSERPILAQKKQYLHRINSFLPEDIVVYDIIPVKESAHARFDAIARTYRYYISCKKNPFATEYAYRIYYSPDIKKMNRCSRILKSFTDFTSFSKLHTQTKTNNCKITEAKWYSDGDLLVFEITADRFLRNMVRAIVGTLLDVGKNKLDEAGFKSLIEAKNRCLAGTSVPAHALFLENIIYPKDIWLL